MDQALSLSNLLSGVIGGILGGLFSMGGVWWQHCLNRGHQRRNEQSLVDGFLRSVRTEVDTIWKRYIDTAGSPLAALPAGQPFTSYYPVYQDYFTFYTGNSFMISRVKDPELQRLIVRTYALAKGLVDSFRMNNEVLQKFEYAESMFRQTNLPAFQQNMHAHHNALAQYAAYLKSHHADLKDHVERLLRTIDGAVA